MVPFLPRGLPHTHLGALPDPPALPALDAGEVTETADGIVIEPPGRPMIDQLIGRLELLPHHEYIGTQSQHLGVGLTALCVRWGTYLATLLDESAPLHPDVTPSVNQPQPQQFSFISDSEMKRLNIEVSYNVARVAQRYHERGPHDLIDLLAQAYLHLPMPQRAVRMDHELGRQLITSLMADPWRASDEGRFTPVPAERADRALANVLAVWGWRNTAIEDVHAGRMPPHPLRAHQRRMGPRQASRILREICGKFASHYFWFDTYFAETPTSPHLPCWPETATALAGSFLGAWASHWSLTDSSSSITLAQ